MTSEISAQELVEQLGTSEVVIVDIRPSAAYNGWKLRGETRGGHIQGAINFPLSWTENVGGEDLLSLLASKGITPDRTIVVYGYEPDESVAMTKTLRELGFENVLIYSGLAEWAENTDLPMAHLPNYQKLVYPAWLDQLISGESPETISGNSFLIFEVNMGKPEEYHAGHIPGAIYLDTNLIEKEPLWNRVSDEELEKVLLEYGITYNTMVVLYDNNMMAAARLASILMYAGVEDVRLLDGGFGAWTRAGYTVETEAHKPTPATAFGLSIPNYPQYIIDIEEAKALLADDDGLLVSVRSWAEYIGETSGYSFIEPKGRIAGAVWGYGGSDAHHMQDYKNIDGTVRSYHEIAANWQGTGITPDKNVAFYCGTGWRAGETFFYAYLMGWPNVAVYDGGWLEWSLDESNPVEQGVPDKST